MSARILYSTLLVLFSIGSTAQFNVGYTLINKIPVLKGGDSLTMAWAGGLNNPQFSPMDFTGDEGKELFVFDRDGGIRKGFQYNENLERYEWLAILDEDTTQNFEQHFPRLYDRGTCLIRDFNGDGKADIFSTYQLDKMKVYKNIGSGTPAFELEKEVLTYGNNLPFRFVRNSIPVIRDLDEDGDLDFMFFPVNYSDVCSFSTFFNQSVETYGNTDSLEFKFDNKCWGKIRVSGGSHPIHNWRGFDCDTTCNIFDGQRDKDITMTQNLHDLNGDGALDLLVTYDHNDELYAMYNSETTQDGIIDQSQNDNLFPSSDVQVKLSNQPYPYFFDVDHDGDDDMLIGSNQINSPNDIEYDTADASICDLYYENVGSNSAPDFNFHSRGYISGEMIDVGLRSFPAFGDLNGDSLPDLIIGNIGYNSFNSELSSARLYYYENVGSIGSPAFELKDEDFANVSSLGLRSVHPTLGDLDLDGDLDLLVGDHTGHVQYYKNIGYPQVYNFSQLTPNFQQIDAGGEAHPQFFDLNNDGLLDIIIGEEYGHVRFYENDGTAAEPDFSSAATVDELGHISLFNELGGNLVPHFTFGLDNSSDLYLCVGSKQGRINIYGPVTNILDTYDLVDSIIVEATETSITGVDLLGDGRDELIIGQRTGGLYFMEKKNNQGVGIRSIKQDKKDALNVFPNPSTGLVSISRKASIDSEAELKVTDIQGRICISRFIKSGRLNENIDLRAYPQGVYLVSVKETDSISWAKLIIE